MNLRPRWCALHGALVLCLAACSGATVRTEAVVTDTAAAVETMNLPHVSVPPIDAEVPAALQTATFALG